MEVYLYKCEVCGVCVFSNQDHGRVWYNDCCGICKTWTYYEKVVIHKIEHRYVFYGPTAEEYKNGISEKEKSTDEH